MKGVKCSRRQLLFPRGAFRANDGDIKLKVPGAAGGRCGPPPLRPAAEGRVSVRGQGSPAAGSKRAGQRLEMEDTMGVDGA